jgi:hypothetical protein
MSAILLPQSCDRQPANTARATQYARTVLSNLYNFRAGAAVTNDLVGDAHLANLADPTRFSTGVSGAGLGLRGDGSSASSAKGLYSGASLKSNGADDVFAFAVVTFDSFSSGTEAAIFRATNGAAGQGVALGWFPSTKTFRPLITAYAWSSGNDSADSSIVSGVPWFVAFRKVNGASAIDVYSNRVGLPPILIRTIVAGGVAGTSGPIYVGGMEFAGGATLTFPGTIHALGISFKPVPLSFLERVSQNPWQLLEEETLPYFFDGGGGVTGTLAYTNANDTLAASGTTTVTGSLATTNANDTSAARWHTPMPTTLWQQAVR